MWRSALGSIVVAAAFSASGAFAKAAPSKSKNADPIMQVIRSNLNDVRKCYEAVLERIPKAEGKIESKFVIEAKTGKVKSVDLASEKFPHDEAFTKCLKSEIQSWTFKDPGAEDVTVTYPFAFSPI